MARVAVVCGLPGSGKTTTAVRLAEQRGAVRFCPDDWMRTLGIDLYDQPARASVERLQWEMAEQLLVLGVEVVIEWGTWSRRERDRLRARCRELGVAVELHHLDVPIDELWARLEARNRLDGEVVIRREDLERWASEDFEPPTPDELALFDPAPGP